MDRLGALSLFTKVVETGSFSEAARQTGRSPASVSRQIRDLEEWVGGRLFNRTTRKIMLTEIGRSYYKDIKYILLDIEEARTKAAQLEGYPTGAIQLTAPTSLEAHITSAVATFQARWPAVDFYISLTDRMVDLVKEGIDMGIRIGRLEDSSLMARKIGETKRFICASPKYLEASGTLERAEDLQNHSCLTFRTSPGYNYWRFSRGGKIISVKASGRFSADSGLALLQAARMGHGLILVPEWLAGPDIKNGALVPVLKKEKLAPATTPVHVIHAYEKFVPPKVKVFTEFLVKRFSDNYDWSSLT